MKIRFGTFVIAAVISLIALPQQAIAQVNLPLKVVLDDPSGACRNGNDVEVTLFFKKGNTRDYVSAELNHCFKKASLNYHLLYPSYGGNFSNFNEEDVWGLQIEFKGEKFFASKYELTRNTCWDLKFADKSVKFHFFKGRWIISVI